MRALILFACLAHVLSAQRVISSAAGIVANEAHGRIVCWIGDVDGDGRDDYAMGSPDTPSAGGASGLGSVMVRSSLTGMLLGYQIGAQSFARLGAALAPAGDADFDGTPDFAAGQPGLAPPGPTPTPNVSALLILSGMGATLIRALPAPAGSIGFASAVANIGDRTGDGIHEYFVGASGSSQVFLIDGFTGATLATINGVPGTRFGCTVALIGDVTGDWIPDVAVGADLANSPTAAGAGSVCIYNGVTLALFRTHHGVYAQDHFGTTIHGMNDVNQDGSVDYACGSPFADLNTLVDVGVVQVLSGATGLPIWERYGTQSYTSTAVANIGEALGETIAFVGDVNFDGIFDIVAGAPGWDSTGIEDCGRALVLSANNGAVLGTLVGTVAEDGLGSGGSYIGDLDMDGCPEVLIGTRGHDTPTLTNAGRVDAVAFGPFLGACAVGGNSIVFLDVNGSTGGPAHRVDIPLANPVTITVNNLSMSPLPAHFVLCAKVGLPAAADVFPLPGVGNMCFPPALLAQWDPTLFILASSIAGVGEIIPATGASWSVALPPLGLAMQVALQPVVLFPPGNAFVANAVLVQTY